MKENFDSPVTQEHSALEVGTMLLSTIQETQQNQGRTKQNWLYKNYF